MLHEGEAFGIAGRILICVTGALPALLVVTGAMIWLRQRRKPRTDQIGAAATAGSDA